MAKPEWGAKRVCQSCGTKFYDFLRDPILCPSCGARYQPDDALKPRRSRVEPKSRAAVKPAPVEEEVEVEEDEEEEDILLDAADEEEDDEEATPVVTDEEEEVEEPPARAGKADRDALPAGDEAEEDEALVEELEDDEDIDVDEDVEEEFEDEEK